MERLIVHLLSVNVCLYFCRRVGFRYIINNKLVLRIGGLHLIAFRIIRAGSVESAVDTAEPDLRLKSRIPDG